MRTFLPLIRPRLSVMVAASALAGYVLCPLPGSPAVAFLLTVGVFLLAAGCSALNQVQERQTDALMERTCRRPVASGRLSPGTGLGIAAGLVATALLLLAGTAEAEVLAAALFALLWYNGVYTLLKRKSSFALIAGSLCGALPPVIGWLAGGGNPADHRIVLLAGLIVLWQTPHFLLLAWRDREGYHRAGLPSLFEQLGERQLARLIRSWLTALATATPLTLISVIHPAPLSLLALAALLTLLAANVLRLRPPLAASAFRQASGRLHLFLALLLGLIFCDGFLF